MKRMTAWRRAQRRRDGLKTGGPADLIERAATEPPACMLDAWLFARDSLKKPPLLVETFRQPPALPR